MTTKHTPGPWQLTHIAGQCYIIEGADASAILSIDRRGDLVDQHANARLIAAAPAMLEALRWAMDNAEWSNDTATGTDPIRAAIAKAEEGGR